MVRPMLLLGLITYMKQLKTGPIRSETKTKLVVIVTVSEKVSSFRSYSEAGRTTKTIAKALQSGVPVAIRIPAN